MFVPFHYGYWDPTPQAPGDATGRRAANELTLTGWDPVSKQPLFKAGAVRIARVVAREHDGGTGGEPLAATGRPAS